jgi:predicted CXXCH cytochrome family protein
LYLCLAIIASCNETKRHRVLTFFFDGVPPLEGLPQDDGLTIDPRTGRQRREIVWTVHAPQRDCDRCHGAQRKQDFSSAVKLVAPVPDLCYQCHTQPTQMSGWVHGPVAAGDCLICHEPHRTVTPHLLKKPVPEICYQCHDPGAVWEIDRHDSPAYAACLDCHSGHASTESHLLKPDRPRVRSATETDRVGEILKFRDQFTIARQAALNGQSLTAVGHVVAELIKQQELDKAKSYLLGALAAETYSREERQVIQQWLQPIEEALRAQQFDREQAVTQRFLESMDHYRAGRLEQALQGLRAVVESGAAAPPIQTAAEAYLEILEKTLSSNSQNGGGRP